MHQWQWQALFVPLLGVLVPPPVAAQTTVTLGSDPTKTVIRGTLVLPTPVIESELVIEDGAITCVGVDCADPPGATVFVVRNAYVFPGFIDAHNHVAYNVLPKWTPPRLYQNRGQWQSAQAYQDFKRPYNTLKDDAGLFCEMVKYGELKALLSGITTIEGTSPNRTCFRTLIRNAENQNELGTPGSTIRTFILDIGSFRGSIDWSVTRAFVVHLAEGVDQASRDEFATLKQKGLLRAQTAIIHGTAFGDDEFREMAAAGAKLIWSPRSNLRLYGGTTNIRLALRHGVEVSLAMDWNPTGSDNMFDELRTAAQVNEEEFDGAIPPSAWIEMITINPARALALDRLIGALALGLRADITVVRAKGADPASSLLASDLGDVQMVFVDGDLLYASEGILQRVKPNQCERLTVHGSRKRVCVRDGRNPVAKSDQRLEDVRAALLARYQQLAPLAP
ncbi:MAG: amidohydrolase family protein [Burkholderiales bacterium]